MAIRNIKFFLFGDFSTIEAQPQKTLDISQKLINNGIPLMPGTFQQVNPTKGLKTFERIMFSAQKDQLSVQIGMDLIEIQKVIVNEKKYNLASETDKFIIEIKKIVKSLNEAHESGIKGLRVSLVVENLYDNSILKSFSNIYEEFNNKIPNYEAEETFEWSIRAVKRTLFKLLEQQEEVNFVSDISRGLGQVTKQGEFSEIDSIHSRIDINTIDANKNLRIDSNFIHDFLEQAKNLYFEQNEAIEVKVLESS